MENERTEDGRDCSRYLNKVKFEKCGVFSLPVLGELMMTLVDITDYNKRMNLQELIVHLRSIHGIQIFVPKDTTKILSKIREIDTRLDHIDSEMVACAVEDGAKYLITLDQKLIGNKRLEEEFNINICHPKDILRVHPFS